MLMIKDPRFLPYHYETWWKCKAQKLVIFTGWISDQLNKNCVYKRHVFVPVQFLICQSLEKGKIKFLVQSPKNVFLEKINSVDLNIVLLSLKSNKSIKSFCKCYKNYQSYAYTIIGIKGLNEIFFLWFWIFTK